MKREKCEFVDATGVAFDKKFQVLEVEFRHGTIYQFFNVPSEEVDALLKKANSETALLPFLKGKYRFSKI